MAQWGKLNEAVQAFDRAQQINPEDAAAWNNLGVAFAAQENRKKPFNIMSGLAGSQP